MIYSLRQMTGLTEAIMRTTLERWLHAVWYNNAPSGHLLRPLSWLYGFIIRLRRRVYRWSMKSRYRAGVPVVVVGNLTVGGAGKTPFVVWLVKQCQRQGIQPGVATRGYGARDETPRLLAAGDNATSAGDEAMLLSRAVAAPIALAPRRADAVAILEAQGVELVVCDDGLQHYGLDRDLEICIVDVERRFGNKRLLPAGPLREPLSRLDEVDEVVWHRQSLQDGEGMALGNPRLRHLLTGDHVSLDALPSQRVHAVAGIGHPERFFSSLESHGLDVVSHPFADHYAFTPDSLTFGDDLPILMTEKDAVKCAAFADSRMYSVMVDTLVSESLSTSIMQSVMSLCRESLKR
ncbi:MAG: tetraacyldisaccharide 4'-kinase [Pseudomonadota bacterium]